LTCHQFRSMVWVIRQRDTGWSENSCAPVKEGFWSVLLVVRSLHKTRYVAHAHLSHGPRN
jgi:hypothetical protein